MKLVGVVLFLIGAFQPYAQNQTDSIIYKIEDEVVLKSVYQDQNESIEWLQGGSCGRTTCGGRWMVQGIDQSGQKWMFMHIVCDSTESFELIKVK